MTRNGSHRARFGPFEVDLYTHELWKFGTRLRLVGQPFEILAVLLSRPGELVTREELRARLWPADTFVDFNHGLNAAVNKLREALSESADAPRYVETLPRRGYRFIATVEWVNSGSTGYASSPVAVAVPAAPAIVHDILPVLPQVPLVFDQKTKVPAARGWLTIAADLVLFLGLLFGGSILLKNVAGYVARPSAKLSPQRYRPLPIIGATEPAFSPDGNSVAFVRFHGNADEVGLFVASVGSDRHVQLTRSDGDCRPAWSPDGRSIAFSRFANQKFTIYIVPSDGGAEQEPNAENSRRSSLASYTPSSTSATPRTLERELDTEGIVPQRGELDWSPDGKSLVFSGQSITRQTGIYLLSLSNSGSTTVRRLTEPPAMAVDWGGTFSPDGKHLLFVREHEMGSPDEIWFASANGDGPARLLSEPGRIVSPPQWSSDGHSVIYSANRSGHPTLWRASFDVPDSVVQIKEAGSPAWDPAISHHGYRMAYERLFRSLSIWQMDISSSGQNAPELLISSTSDTDQGPAPQFSPDGKKLAYMSDASGTMEIWVSNRDGSNPFQLTAVGVAGTPRWSPDSQSIVFDANSPDGTKVLTASLRGGAPVVVTPEKFESEVPSYSRDGKWIYFASNRSGDVQVWKVPIAGGVPVQVTQHGGHAALESLDGKTLYYAKSFVPEPEIWQVRTDGGPETLVPLVRPGTWASWQVVEGGILFVGPSLGHQAVLSFYDFSHQRTTTIAVLDRTPFWLGATLDGHTIAFDQPGQEQAQTMLVENFR